MKQGKNMALKTTGRLAMNDHPSEPDPFVPYSEVYYDSYDSDAYQAIHISTEAAADFSMADVISTDRLATALLHAGFRSVQFSPRVWEFKTEGGDLRQVSKTMSSP